MIAIHPEDHSLIKGTVDHVPATALVDPKGFSGDGDIPFVGETELHWNGQWTEETGGEKLFISREGYQCKRSELLLRSSHLRVRVDGAEGYVDVPRTRAGLPDPSFKDVVDAAFVLVQEGKADTETAEEMENVLEAVGITALEEDIEEHDLVSVEEVDQPNGN